MLLMAGFLLFYIQPMKVMSKDIANGQEKYIANCLSCHGEKGYGDGPIAASLAKAPADINAKFKTSWKPANRLVRRILVGKPETGMPAFNTTLSEKDAQDILAYVRSIDPLFTK